MLILNFFLSCLYALKNWHEHFDAFWKKHPALLYGLALTLGCSAALGFPFLALSGGIILYSPLFFKPSFSSLHLSVRLVLATALACCTTIWVSYNHTFIPLPAKGLNGSAIISLHSVNTAAHSFGTRWIYRGQLKSFTKQDSETPTSLKNIPITLSLPSKDGLNRPKADCDYVIKGHLTESQMGKYHLKPFLDEPWLPISNSWSLAEWRYTLKQKVKSYILQNYKTSRSQVFLAGIATGDFDDHLLAQDFSRFGLQHIMAISGFHYSIIANFLSLILTLFLPRKIATLILLGLLTGYFLFIGPTASVMRAWILYSIVCLGALYEKKAFSLNSLGIALIGVILYDPLAIQSLGFQFSFATTAAILLLYQPVDQFLQIFLKKRSLTAALNMPNSDQHAYIILCLMRQGISLGITVNLIAIPMTLFYFHQFPWMSFIFNLFFPFLVSLAMIFLLVGSLGTAVWPLAGQFIHRANDIFTQLMLNLTTHLPKVFDSYLTVSFWPAWLAISCIIIVLLSGIILHTAREKEIGWA